MSVKTPMVENGQSLFRLSLPTGHGFSSATKPSELLWLNAQAFEFCGFAGARRCFERGSRFGQPAWRRSENQIQTP